MQVKENENNPDQYEHYQIDKRSNTEEILDILINRKRFLSLKETHMHKYSSAEYFWEMFERDLFDTEK